MEQWFWGENFVIRNWLSVARMVSDWVVIKQRQLVVVEDDGR